MRTLDYIVKLIFVLQGKGYGSTSIKSEVIAIEKFIDGGVFIDVGANKGVYSRELIERFSKKMTELHVFEPSKDLIENHLSFSDQRVRVNNFALSKESGTVPLFKVRGNSGLNSLTKRRLDHFDVQMNDVEEIRVITLDEYVSKNNITKIDLLKIDVEGHELDVLYGALGCLTDNKIRCIQFEFGGCNIDTRSFFQDFWYLLVVKFSFTMYRITPFSVSPLKGYSELDEIFLTTNFIAVRKE